MKTTLTVEIEYDPTMTDPDSLACAMDRLLETALSTPDILADYGNPRVGEFFVAKETTRAGTEDRPEPFRRCLAGRVWFGLRYQRYAGRLGCGRLQSLRQRHRRASRRARRHAPSDGGRVPRVAVGTTRGYGNRSGPEGGRAGRWRLQPTPIEL